VTAPTPFDLTGPLPTGTTVLEASAGTGKTYTIAGLVTRWVAETDIRLRSLLVVTFTRAATAELRGRVRRRLVEAGDHLDHAAAGTQSTMGDPVLEALASVPSDEIARRRRRIARALGDIDAATISTIHGFCQHVLDGIGIASDLDREADLVEDLDELVEEVVDDLLVSTYLRPNDHPRIARGELLAIGRAVVGNPTTRLAPRGTADPTAGLRLHLADRIRTEVPRRARRRRRLSYDDLLTRLDAVLADPERGAGARAALRQRYAITLIDEFQDTDAVQWSIVAAAFADAADQPGRALVLIGDPKQAIYAFRGADVHAYLSAARRAATRHTLGVNHRSDRALLTALDTLFAGCRFGDDDIRHRGVGHARAAARPRLSPSPGAAALRLRVVPRHGSLGLNKRRQPFADRVRDLIALDLAADVVRMLAAQPDLITCGDDGVETSRRVLAPGDVAVLVRTNEQAGQVQAALQAVDVPAVVGGVDSVFATPAATHWTRLLDALERPSSGPRVRALALTPWIGWTADDVVAAPEPAWDRLHGQVHGWSAVLRDQGVAAAFRAVLLACSLRSRLLAQHGGERLLADLEHLAELAHAAATAEHLGTTGLVGWLRVRIAGASRDVRDDRLRRLETDDDAVQILTIHRSKGLEFPVVYCPFAWSSNTGVRGVPAYHDDDRQRWLDVGGRAHDDYADHAARAEDDARGEELRLLYVAMTRARHHVVAWYAPAGNTAWSGLGRLLLCRDPDGTPDTERAADVLDDDHIRATVEALAARSDGTITVETVPERPSAVAWQRASRPGAELDRARFTRGLDTSWRRTSYSALTRLDDPGPHVGSERDEAVTDDEPSAPDGARGPTRGVAVAHGGDEVTLPLADMPGGTQVGTFVHGVLEEADFAADDLRREFLAAVAKQQTRRRLDLDAEMVGNGLVAAVTTPLGAAADGISLAAIRRDDRRDEVAFELPLDHAGCPATLGDLAEVLADHLSDDDPLAGYPRRLPDRLRRRDLRGYLGGSIDLVMRRRASGHEVFHVADYKTNRLGRWDRPLTLGDYHPDALAEAMVHGHYPIQALLYQVALHRLLRWRVVGYDPAVHLGPVLYLFVRGMVGPNTPELDGNRAHGVFAWRLPPSLVTATSDLLHVGRS
jgi:exodeoxyribonuclease V beta subunit